MSESADTIIREARTAFDAAMDAVRKEAYKLGYAAGRADAQRLTQEALANVFADTSPIKMVEPPAAGHTAPISPPLPPPNGPRPYLFGNTGLATGTIAEIAARPRARKGAAGRVIVAALISGPASIDEMMGVAELIGEKDLSPKTVDNRLRIYRDAGKVQLVNGKWELTPTWVGRAAELNGGSEED